MCVQRSPHTAEAIAERSVLTSSVILPLGPYHPAFDRPLALDLSLAGERVSAATLPRGGYCARGTVEAARGLPLDQALDLIERSCGLAGNAHRLALVLAVEQATGAQPTRPAQVCRILFAEMERFLARLWLLGWTARALELPNPYREALDQRERLFDALVAATGERQYWAVAVPGGIRADLDLEPLRSAIEGLPAILETWRIAVGPRGPLGRAGADLGPLPEAEVPEPDLRRTAPYGGYDALEVSLPARTPGAADVAGRMARAVDDLAESSAYMQECLRLLEDGNQVDAAVRPTQAARAAATGEAHVQGPHGPVTVRATLAAAGHLQTLAISTPAWQTAAQVPAALAGAYLSQVPGILASLDLCPECMDLAAPEDSVRGSRP